MLLAVAIIVTAVIVFAVGALTMDRFDRMSPAVGDAPSPSALPNQTLSPDDVRSVRFGMALRGYRMAEVDVMLSTLAEELAWRDEELARRDDEIVRLAEFARVDRGSADPSDREGGAGTAAVHSDGWANS